MYEIDQFDFTFVITNQSFRAWELISNEDIGYWLPGPMCKYDRV